MRANEGHVETPTSGAHDVPPALRPGAPPQGTFKGTLKLYRVGMPMIFISTPTAMLTRPPAHLLSAPFGAHTCLW
jgi:hypothetical protein